jgi:hypothetical protein
LSQYPYNPSPYQPPPFNYGSGPMFNSPLRPARIAFVLQLILGICLVLLPTCLITSVMVVRQQMPQMYQQQVSNMQLPPGVTVDDVLREAMIRGGVSIVLGLVLIVLAFFVRRGGRTSSITSSVLVGILALFMFLALLGVLQQMLSAPSGQAMFSLIFVAAGLALCGATLARLIMVARSPQDLRSLAMQSQYWEMMQQQGGYGYGYPPPPPAGAAPIGSPPPPPSQSGGPQGPPPPATPT